MRHPRRGLNASHAPGRHSGSPPGRPGRGPTAVRCRVARRETRTHPLMRRGPAIRACPRPTSGRPAKSGQRASRRATPLIWGTAKETGPPRARPKRGASMALAFSFSFPDERDLNASTALNVDRHPEARPRLLEPGEPRRATARIGPQIGAVHPSRRAEFIIGPAEGRTRWRAPQDDRE